MKDNKNKINGQQDKGAGVYSGVAIDIADDEKVTSQLVEEEIKSENNISQ